MADLLYKIRIIITCFVLFSATCAFAYESSFPFPFEFGHSSDIYLDVKKKETKETRQQNQIAIERLRENGIKTDNDSIIKYIKKNNYTAVKLLLDAGLDPNKNVNANSLLYYAAKYNRKPIINMLLKSGAKPNNDLMSPLRYAVVRKDYDCTKLFLEHGADPNYTDTVTDETLLYTALKKGQYEIALLLLNSGAKIDFKSYKLIKKKNLEKKLGITIN